MPYLLPFDQLKNDGTSLSLLAFTVVTATVSKISDATNGAEEHQLKKWGLLQWKHEHRRQMSLIAARQPIRHQLLRRDYRLEDFFWHGSGDGGIDDSKWTDEPVGIITITVTKTVLVTDERTKYVTPEVFTSFIRSEEFSRSVTFRQSDDDFADQSIVPTTIQVPSAFMTFTVPIQVTPVVISSEIHSAESDFSDTMSAVETTSYVISSSDMAVSDHVLSSIAYIPPDILTTEITTTLWFNLDDTISSSFVESEAYITSSFPSRTTEITTETPAVSFNESINFVSTLRIQTVSSDENTTTASMPFSLLVPETTVRIVSTISTESNVISVVKSRSYELTPAFSSNLISISNEPDSVKSRDTFITEYSYELTPSFSSDAILTSKITESSRSRDIFISEYSYEFTPSFSGDGILTVEVPDSTDSLQSRDLFVTEYSSELTLSFTGDGIFTSRLPESMDSIKSRDIFASEYSYELTPSFTSSTILTSEVPDSDINVATDITEVVIDHTPAIPTEAISSHPVTMSTDIVSDYIVTSAIDDVSDQILVTPAQTGHTSSVRTFSSEVLQSSVQITQHLTATISDSVTPSSSFSAASSSIITLFSTTETVDISTTSVPSASYPDLKYWIRTVLQYNSSSDTFDKLDTEQKLAAVYSVGFQRLEQDLLGILPLNQSLIKKHKHHGYEKIRLKRTGYASFIMNVSVMIFNSSSTVLEDTTRQIELLYMVGISSVPVVGWQAVDAMDYVTKQEMAEEFDENIGIIVKAEAMVKAIMDAEVSRAAPLWIIAVVVGIGVAVVLIGCLVTLIVKKNKPPKLVTSSTETLERAEEESREDEIDDAQRPQPPAPAKRRKPSKRSSITPSTPPEIESPSPPHRPQPIIIDTPSPSPPIPKPRKVFSSDPKRDFSIPAVRPFPKGPPLPPQLPECLDKRIAAGNPLAKLSIRNYDIYTDPFAYTPKARPKTAPPLRLKTKVLVDTSAGSDEIFVDSRSPSEDGKDDDEKKAPPSPSPPSSTSSLCGTGSAPLLAEDEHNPVGSVRQRFHRLLDEAFNLFTSRSSLSIANSDPTPSHGEKAPTLIRPQSSVFPTSRDCPPSRPRSAVSHPKSAWEESLQGQPGTPSSSRTLSSVEIRHSETSRRVTTGSKTVRFAETETSRSETDATNLPSAKSLDTIIKEIKEEIKKF